MAILLFIIVHWYVSLFFQSVFHHRYAAHGLFTMSRGWEKVFHIGCFLTQGSSYISAYTYGLMHRLHHAHTDKENDPHSPHNTPNMFVMMWATRNSYFDLYIGRTDAEDKYKKGLPEWRAFDKVAHNWITRIIWVVIYVAIYAWLATAWWQFLFLPVTLAMGSFQGVAVNWWAHRFGYENFKMDNTSKNILPVDFLFWGEAYHNNHHKHPTRPNNAIKWFEIDMGYLAMRALDKIGVIRMKYAA
jgi:stearoyl-CoA desaturase (delta-9 desaturase)